MSNKEIMDKMLGQKLSSWHLSGFTIGMVVYYSFLFCIGLIGNFWVITVLVYIIKNLRLSMNQNVFIYILCLSSVDALVVMLLPILLSDTILFHWIFGETLCKLYMIAESTNKMLSTFILAMLSFDRYLAVCRPNDVSFMRTPKGTMIIVICLLVLVSALLTPVYIYAQQIIVDDFVIVENHTFSIGAPKCTLNMSTDVIIIFTVYLFLVGFCLPSIFIIYFYGRVLVYIYEHTKSVRFRRTQIPVKRITGATLLIVVFYFTCWTPYWVSTILGAFISETHNFGPLAAKIFYIIHSLVYVNSSFNWVFYAFLNSHLRYSHDMAIEKKRSRTSSWILPRIARLDSRHHHHRRQDNDRELEENLHLKNNYD